jgi:hypothetical protein
MRKRVFLLVAILLGFCVAFLETVMWTRVSYRYEPGISQVEFQQLSQMTHDQAEAFLAARRKPYSRKEWLRDSLSDGYFWKYLAEKSAIPAMGIFIACLIVGRRTRHGTQIKDESG